jgi:hypothetical protein
MNCFRLFLGAVMVATCSTALRPPIRMPPTGSLLHDMSEPPSSTDPGTPILTTTIIAPIATEFPAFGICGYQSGKSFCPRVCSHRLNLIRLICVFRHRYPSGLRAPWTISLCKQRIVARLHGRESRRDGYDMVNTDKMLRQWIPRVQQCYSAGPGHLLVRPRANSVDS